MWLLSLLLFNITYTKLLFIKRVTVTQAYNIYKQHRSGSTAGTAETGSQLCVSHSSRSLKSGELASGDHGCLFQTFLRKHRRSPGIRRLSGDHCHSCASTMDMIGYQHAVKAACRHGDWHVSLQLPEASIGRRRVSAHGCRPELNRKPLRGANGGSIEHGVV